MVLTHIECPKIIPGSSFEAAASEKEISREEGLLKGREEGIRALIMDNLEKQVPEDIIIQKLQRYFSLDKEKVTAYLSTSKKEYVSIYGEREKI